MCDGDGEGVWVEGWGTCKYSLLGTLVFVFFCLCFVCLFGFFWNTTGGIPSCKDHTWDTTLAKKPCTLFLPGTYETQDRSMVMPLDIGFLIKWNIRSCHFCPLIGNKKLKIIYVSPLHTQFRRGGVGVCVCVWEGSVGGAGCVGVGVCVCVWVCVCWLSYLQSSQRYSMFSPWMNDSHLTASF